MRAVFSAMRRSLAIAAIALASSSRGARRTSRFVSRTAIQLSASGGGGRVSRQVMAGSLVKKLRGGAGIPSPPRTLEPVLSQVIRRGFRMPADHWDPPFLFGRRFRHREYRHVRATFGFGVELNATVDLGEKRVVLADTHIVARVPLGAALTHDNIARETRLAAEQLHAEALAVGVATVARRSAGFLVGHKG